MSEYNEYCHPGDGNSKKKNQIGQSTEEEKLSNLKKKIKGEQRSES